jgi:hypothetical protein
MVACRYSQKYGRNYDYTLAPSAMWKSICILLHLAAIHDWDVLSYNVENAYLEATLDKEIYMYLPQDLYQDEKGDLSRSNCIRACMD